MTPPGKMGNRVTVYSNEFSSAASYEARLAISAESCLRRRRSFSWLVPCYENDFRSLLHIIPQVGRQPTLDFGARHTFA
jgi:hypothetical protein